MEDETRDLGEIGDLDAPSSMLGGIGPLMGDLPAAFKLTPMALSGLLAFELRTTIYKEEERSGSLHSLTSHK